MSMEISAPRPRRAEPARLILPVAYRLQRGHPTGRAAGRRSSMSALEPDLPGVEGDVAAEVTADTLGGELRQVRVGPGSVLQHGVTHEDIVVLGVALPRTGVLSRRVAQGAGCDGLR